MFRNKIRYHFNIADVLFPKPRRTSQYVCPWLTLSPLSITHFAMVIYVWLVLARIYQFFTSAFYFVTSDSFPPVDSENSLTLIELYILTTNFVKYYYAFTLLLLIIVPTDRYITNFQKVTRGR